MRTKKPTLRTIALALIAVSLLATLAFAGTESPREQRVMVQFMSKPDYADLYVDGKFVGSTDVVLRVPTGEHVIEMKRDGYDTWRRDLVVTADNSTRVAALLIRDKP